MNFFIQESAISDMENVHEVAILASRIYLVLLGSSISVLMLYTGLIQLTTSVTIQSPSLALYDQLQEEYPQLLSCPCKQIATPYGKFISIAVSYHQVKDSTFGMISDSERR